MTIDEKLSHFYDITVEEAHEKAAAILDEHKAALEKMAEEHKTLSEENAQTQIKAETASARGSGQSPPCRIAIRPPQKHARTLLPHTNGPIARSGTIPRSRSSDDTPSAASSTTAAVAVPSHVPLPASCFQDIRIPPASALLQLMRKVCIT